MKRTHFSHKKLQQRLDEILTDPEQIARQFDGVLPLLPLNLSAWLGRLALLKGVPFNYLVPDETMLPPESIRFFELDLNWTDALLDGAYSIGRNLTNDHADTTTNLDRAMHPGVRAAIKKAMPLMRAQSLGMEPVAAPVQISGFLLRSAVVTDYPSLGANVYPEGGEPVKGNTNATMLNILRLEKLGPTSDTLIGLVAADPVLGGAYRIDIHEAPQVLHYGLDCFNSADCKLGGNNVLAIKKLFSFSVKTAVDPGTGLNTQKVTMQGDPVDTDVSNCFRTPASRVVSMSRLAALMGKAKTNAASVQGAAPPPLDAAEMGFEMTEGVGMVTFKNAIKKPVRP